MLQKRMKQTQIHTMFGSMAGLRAGDSRIRFAHAIRDEENHQRQEKEDAQRRVAEADADGLTGADAEVPAIDVSIVLPHDGIISTLFFRCWTHERVGCIAVGAGED